MSMQDTFTVTGLNRDGKRFDNVSRVEAEGESLEMLMTLDVNTAVYPIKENEKYVVLLTSTLNKDGSAVGDYYTQQPGRDNTIAEKFEYIMRGKIYKFAEEGSGANAKAEIYVSFGGLLMLLRGNPSYVVEFELDQYIFLCMRRL